MSLLILAADSAAHPGLYSRLTRRSRCYDLASLSTPVFHLRHLLRAGLPLVDALRDVSTSEATPSRRALWSQVADDVASGETLSQALAHFPQDFDATSCALVRAGESSGRLACLLGDLEEQLHWRHAVSARLRTVLVYPVFALALLVAVFVFLLGQVVPSLAGFITDSGRALEWHGELLLWLSDGIIAYGPVVAFSVVSVGSLIVAATRLSEPCARMRDRLLASCGMPGALVVSLCLARWARTTALLYQSGVELVDALPIAEAVVGNRALQAELSAVRARVLAGESMGAALSRCTRVPERVSRLVAAGEAAGAVDEALHGVAACLQASTQHRVARIEAMIGPVLLSLTGGLLLWIVVSVMLPLYASLDMGALS